MWLFETEMCKRLEFWQKTDFQNGGLNTRNERRLAVYIVSDKGLIIVRTIEAEMKKEAK